MEPIQETPPVNQPTTPFATSSMNNPENKPKKSHKALFILFGLLIIVILAGGMGGGYYLGRSSITKELNPSSPAIPPKDPDIYKGTPTPSPSPTTRKILKSEDLYSINLPEGWSKISEKKGNQNELNIQYANNNGDYLIVEVNGIGRGFASDEYWETKLNNNKDGIVVFQKNSPCEGEETSFCLKGDNKLTIGVKSEDIKSNHYFFLVGNDTKENNINTDVYKQIIEGIKFN